MNVSKSHLRPSSSDLRDRFALCSCLPPCRIRADQSAQRPLDITNAPDGEFAAPATRVGFSRPEHAPPSSRATDHVMECLPMR